MKNSDRDQMLLPGLGADLAKADGPKRPKGQTLKNLPKVRRKGVLKGPKASAIAFVFGEIQVLSDALRMVNLTQMYEAAGRPKHKEPWRWRRNPVAASFIKTTASALNLGISEVLRTTSGRGGQTWAHWQVALAYAKYLSDDFHRFVNDAFMEWVEEELDPELKVNHAIRIWKRDKKSGAWIQIRLMTVAARNDLTACLKAHECVKTPHCNPYADAARLVSWIVLGDLPRGIRKARGIKRNTRDGLTFSELVDVLHAEDLARTMIQANDSKGNEACLGQVDRASRLTRQARQQALRG
jgi:hypothetical protein